MNILGNISYRTILMLESRNPEHMIFYNPSILTINNVNIYSNTDHIIDRTRSLLDNEI